jgi:hypothetical protein
MYYQFCRSQANIHVTVNTIQHHHCVRAAVLGDSVAEKLRMAYGIVSAGEKFKWQIKMERRSRGDVHLTFSTLFLLGVSAGVIIGVFVTFFQLYNPISGIINLKYGTAETVE